MFERVPIPRNDESGRIISEGDVIELIVPNDDEPEERAYTFQRVQIVFSKEDCAFMLRCFFKEKGTYKLEEMLPQESLIEEEAKIVGNIHDEPWLEHTLGWKYISEKEIPK